MALWGRDGKTESMDGGLERETVGLCTVPHFKAVGIMNYYQVQ